MSADAEPMERYRTAPLRFPLHVLDEDGEPLCGAMADDQERFIERYGLDGQPTLREKAGDEPLTFFLGNLCGNCRSSLLSKNGTGALQEAWEERQRRIAQEGEQ